ncbi:MAG: tripartite tricarboxylate transporter substrate binding protein [Proteobacteria bacterium]|nr:tripartite tricarboxylate transporter substrate binding protein [Burkholderiales bacterium]
MNARRFSAVAMATATSIFATGLAAQPVDFSRRPVRIIVPFAPGGASDFVGRIIQPRLAEELGTQVVLDNRAGAAGNIGVEVAGRASPDGFTLLLGNVGTMAINPSLFPDFPLKPLKDFIAVIQVVDVPGALVANPSLPPSSVSDLVAYAKANPNKLNFASPGSGSGNRIEMEIFMRAAGIQMTHIPYKGGAGPAVTSLLQNETQLGFVTLSSAMNFVKAGKLKMLGIVASVRNPGVPDVPTMAETGFKSMRTGSWQGVFVPAGTPRPVVNRLFTAMQKVMEHPDVRRRLNEGGAEVVVSRSPEEFTAFVKVENERFARAIKDAGITAD